MLHYEFPWLITYSCFTLTLGSHLGNDYILLLLVQHERGD